MPVPAVRVRSLNPAPVVGQGDYVLYWMIANRRPGWNFSLDRAVEWCRELGKPLVILEALRIGYRWACDRFHQFVIDGMRDNRKALEGKPVLYYPYLEPEQDADKGLLESLAGRACVVVTDDFPCFFLPRMLTSAAPKLTVKLEAVDSNGLYPMRATDRLFHRAVDFRRHLQKQLEAHLDESPQRDAFSHLDLPVLETVPELEKWPPLPERVDLPELAIDHQVGPVAFPGGHLRGERLVEDFVERRLGRYAEDRNEPEKEATSSLSPYLHFGFVSAHQVFHGLAGREEWSPNKLSLRSRGQREGWWGMSEPAEAFLDQLVTWRELGYNMCCLRPEDYDRYESLPDWARKTLQEHAGDPREHVYSLDEFDRARTHEPLWNAAQNQLRREGSMHNSLRMLWGKKILHWSRSPREALEILIELNNRYALDGRNPNSYSGIFWVLGRYDRPWGPERPIFGKIRYMTCASTRRKLKVDGYVKRYSSVP